MTAGWGARTIRAAVFAAVCVLLAALGHALMSGAAVPRWTVAAGFAGTCTVGWFLAGRERGLAPVVTATVLAQTALHSAFSWGRPGTRMETRMETRPGAWPVPGGADTGSAGHSMGGDTTGMPMDAAHAAHAAHMTHLDHPAMAHDVGDASSFGMLAAHVSAALLSGLWLAHGERAAFRLLRTVAGRLAAPLRLPTEVLPVPAYRPARGPLCERARRAPRAPLADPFTSRGPPRGTAVV
ncbi:hypothetical protein ACPYPG_01320 [Streptomyces sp. FR-108]|uniref:hypothetical protein n=1 Tax=Streptomyces sp. FR-108 TaxID=3416665 RepID=UPI003CF52C14